MYKTPIEIIYAQTQTQIEGDIFKAIQSYGINVDKNELIQALQYDRDQYEKGYADGKRDAMAELVRCKDCKYYENKNINLLPHCILCGITKAEDDFCSCGERREGE